VTNSLAYYDAATITVVKRYIRQVTLAFYESLRKIHHKNKVINALYMGAEQICW
jgi:hypothetical protein